MWLWCVNVVLITGGISPGKIYFFILQKFAEPQSRVSPLLSRLLEFDCQIRGILASDGIVNNSKQIDTLLRK